MIMKFHIILVVQIWFLCANVSGLAQSSSPLVPYLSGGKWGFADTSGTITIQPKYDTVFFFKGDYAKVRISNKYGYINTMGKEVVPVQYDDTRYEESDKFEVATGGKWGVVGPNRKIYLSIDFDNIKHILGKYYITKKARKYGAFKLEKKHFIKFLPHVYDSIIYYYTVDAFECRTGRDSVTLIDTSKHVIKTYTLYRSTVSDDTLGVIEPNFDMFFEDHERTDKLRPYKLGSKMGLIVKLGRSEDTIAAVFDSVVVTEHHNLILVRKGNHWGAINEEGQTILELLYDSVDVKASSMVSFRPYTQRFRVYKNGKLGIVGNRNGYNQFGAHNEVLIPISYDAIYTYGRGDYLIVSNNGKFGVVSHNSFKNISETVYKDIQREWVYGSKWTLFRVTDFEDNTFFMDTKGKVYYKGASNQK